MAVYLQSCSQCTGPSITAYHDIGRYQREYEWHTGMASIATQRSANPPMRHGSGHDGTVADYAAEAEYHASLARSAEWRLTRARKRFAGTLDPGPCVLCGGTGSITPPGTFLLGRTVPVGPRGATG